MLFFVGLWKLRKKLVDHLLRLMTGVVTILKFPRVLLKMLPRNVDVGPAHRVLEPRPVAIDALCAAAILRRVLPGLVVHGHMLVAALLEAKVALGHRQLDGAGRGELA